MPDFADDTSSELERKARALKFMALFETVTYLLLFYFWIVAPNDAIKATAQTGKPRAIAFCRRALR